MLPVNKVAPNTPAPLSDVGATWLAPRVDIAYQKAGDVSSTDTNFGLSGGLELNLLNGFGVHAAYDRVFAKDIADPATFGVGAHYAFRVPGL